MISILAIFVTAAWGVTCHDRFVDWQAPKSICQEWKRSGETLATYGNGEIVPNPLRTFSAKLFKPAKLETLTSDFNLLVRMMTEQVAGDTPNGSLSTSRRYLASRLSSVALELLPETDLLCAPGTQVNARYTERTNRIQVCPLTTRLPLAAWLPLFAHELGHLADPCNFREGFQFTELVPRTRDGIQRVVRACGVPALAEILSDGDHRADRAVPLTPSSNKTSRTGIHKLVSCGLLRPLSDSSLPAKFEGHPYFTDTETATRALGGKACDLETESAADRIGFRVLTAFLKTHPPRVGTEWITYFYASVNCAATEHTGGRSEYSSSASRIEALLRLPEVRTLAKCD